MNLVKQKQIAELERDIFNSYFGSDVFIRNTILTLNIPGVGEACVDSDIASEITTLRINCSDSIIGNAYSILSEFSQYDTLILKSTNNSIAKYKINQISEEVDQFNEGYFILTLQHSFGYSTSLTNGVFTYYLKKSASEDLVENEKVRAMAVEASLAANLQAQINVSSQSLSNLQADIDQNEVDSDASDENEKVRAMAAEAQLSASIAAVNSAVQNSKTIYTLILTQGVAVTVPHTLGTDDFIIQVTEDGRVVTHDMIITQITDTSFVIQPNVSATFKIILMI